MNSRYPHPPTEQDFEHFCLKLLQRHWVNSGLNLYGRRGDPQVGVDIVDLTTSSPFKAAQCKHHEPGKTIPPKEIQEEVDKALRFDPPLEHYAILTTGKATVYARNKIIEINKCHRLLREAHGASTPFVVELLDWDDIGGMLVDYPNLTALLTPLSNAHLVELNETVAAGFARIETRLDTTTDSAVRTSLDAEIDKAEHCQKNYDPDRAQIYFEGIKHRHWEELSSQQKFRVKVGLSNIALVRGDDVAAGRLLLEAKDICPESERALVNEVLGLEFIGDLDGAHRLAAERLKTHPSSSKLVASFIRTAPFQRSLEDLGADIFRLHADDGEVCTALGLRAMRLSLFDEAASYARNAAASSPEWFGPKFLLGQALLNGQLTKQKRYPWQEASPPDAEKLREGVSVMDAAIALARRQHARHVAADSLVIRALAKELLGEHSAAEDDFHEALKEGPSDASVHHHYATFLFERRRFDEAISHLRRSVSLRPRADVEFFLANLLSVGDRLANRRESTAIYTRLALSSPESIMLDPLQFGPDKVEFLRVASFHSAMEEFMAAGSFDEAEAFLERAMEHFDPLGLYAARSKVQISRGNHESASTLADEALRQVDEGSSELDLRALALQLDSLERHREALPLWLRLNEATLHREDIRHLVRCAERLSRYDVVLKVASVTREAGVFDEWLFYREVATLEDVDHGAAIRLLQDRLEIHPSDKHARLMLSYVGLRWGRPDVIDARPEALPSVEEATAVDGAIAVDVLRQHGDPNQALRYAYELVRRYPDHPEANASLVRVFFDPSSRGITDLKVAGIDVGTAVRYVEADGRERWVVIQDSPNPRIDIGEFSPSHQVAVALKGKHVGETVTLAPTSGRDRTATIKEILPKYVRKLHEIMHEWQLNFPDRPLVQMFSVAVVDPATGEAKLDFTDLKLIADRRFEQATETIKLYQNHVIPLDFFARCIGCSPFQAVFLAATHQELMVRSNHGRESDQLAALESLKTAPTLVLDLTALAMLSLLQLEGLLERWPGKLVVSQSTAKELRTAREALADKPGRVGHYGRNETGYFAQEVPAEVSRAEYEAFAAFADTVLDACDVQGCPALLDLDPERREDYIQAFGQHGIESILLARNPGHVLWTDDVAVSEVASADFAVRRVWVQPVLIHAAGTGLISVDNYLAATAKLVGFDYQATTFNIFAAVKAGSMAAWDAGKWPFNRMLEQLARPSTPEDQAVLLATAIAVNMYRETMLAATRHSTFIKMLELLAARPNGLDRVDMLLAVLPEVFGVNVLAADEVSSVGRAWLALAKRRPRFDPPKLITGI